MSDGLREQDDAASARGGVEGELEGARTFTAAPVAEHARFAHEEAPQSGALPGTADPAAGSIEPGESEARRERAHAFVARCAYWTPVFVAVVLFAQVSFLGLRPALAEAGRLSDAEVMLEARQNEALTENRALALHLEARQDPIFRERQRRLRQIAPPAANDFALPHVAAPETAPDARD